MSIHDIRKALRRTFQGILKNIVSLANDSTLENDLKPLKVGDKATKIELSDTETKISGKLTVDSNAETNIKTTHGLNLWSTSGTLDIKSLDAGIEIEGTAVNVTSVTRDIGVNSERDIGLSTKRDILLEHDDTIFGLFDGGTSSAKSRMFLYEAGGSSTDDYFLINVTAGGATTLRTWDAGGAVAHLTLEVDGELNLIPETEIKSDAPLKIKEAANAVADTAAYGQLWVKTATPNELYFTTDAGDDIQLTSGTSTAGGGGSVSEFYETKVCNYYTNSVNNQFIPLAGYVIERDTIASQNEYVSMVAPYNGTIERIMFRSETAQNGTIEFDIFESSDNTETPGTITGVKDTVVTINDDVTVEIDFDSMTSGTNALVKGRIYAIQVDTPSIPYDTNITVVFKWDVTT